MKQVSGTLETYLPLSICTSEPQGTEFWWLLGKEMSPIPPGTL